MNIINTYTDIMTVFDTEHFNLEKWKACIDKCVPGARKVWLKDRKSDFERGVV